MPIFRDPDPHRVQPDPDTNRPEEPAGPPPQEDIRSEYHDGPSPETENRPASPIKVVLAAIDNTSLSVSDRVELIERIKRGESPTWLPNRTLEDYYQDLNKLSDRCPSGSDGTAGQSLPSQEVRLDEEAQHARWKLEEKPNSPAEIERPKSALHSGDFTEDTLPCQEPLHSLLASGYETSQGLRGYESSYSSTAWHGGGSQDPYGDIDQKEAVTPQYTRNDEEPLSTPASIPLQAFHRTFTPNLPSSPLAQSFTNADADISPSHDYVDVPTGKYQGSRRHTLPPHPFLSFQSSPPGLLPISSQFGRPPAPLRREGRPPYQTHQARRSLTSPLVPHQQSLPSTPAYGLSRRPSLSSDVSPLHLAPMVGSYEESILRGRMSTAPSKPLDFMAQIGVLGLGKCKPNLRCPAHVSVPFPAVFYSYGKANVGRSSILEDGPSPYVGLIDLENSLAKNRVQKEEGWRKSFPIRTGGYNSSHEDDEETSAAQPTARTSENDLRLRIKKQRRSHSPKAPPGGSYRIPQTGQLQIVIKNPNKTAVKLFLVPYDLQDMQPGTRTFIRQRSYSTGPIIETPLSSKTNKKETESTESKVPGPAELKDRPTLRYLIHLHICSPCRDRFYLYKSIRVVFANRVPDGKEKLRNEIQLPEPRYTAYKPGRELSMGNPFSFGADPTAGKIFQRRSSAFVMGSEAYDALDGIPQAGQRASSNVMIPFVDPSDPTYRPEMPLHLGAGGSIPSQSDLATAPGNRMNLDQSHPDTSSGEIYNDNPRDVSWHQFHDHHTLISPLTSRSRTENEYYAKLNRGEAGYGGHGSGLPAGSGGERGEGLLARKLRGLDVQHDLKWPNEFP